MKSIHFLNIILDTFNTISFDKTVSYKRKGKRNYVDAVEYVVSLMNIKISFSENRRTKEIELLEVGDFFDIDNCICYYNVGDCQFDIGNTATPDTKLIMLRILALLSNEEDYNKYREKFNISYHDELESHFLTKNEIFKSG